MEWKACSRHQEVTPLHTSRYQSGCWNLSWEEVGTRILKPQSAQQQYQKESTLSLATEVFSFLSFTSCYYDGKCGTWGDNCRRPREKSNPNMVELVAAFLSIQTAAWQEGYESSYLGNIDWPIKHKNIKWILPHALALHSPHKSLFLITRQLILPNN